MKKRILILSCMAASLLGTLMMPFHFGYGERTVLAEETDDSEEDALQAVIDSIVAGDTGSDEEGAADSEEDLEEYAASISDDQIISYSESNFDVLINQIDLENYDPETSTDAAMVNDWYELHEAAGAYISTDAKYVERDGRKLKGILETTCENMKVRFVFTFDVETGLESITADEIVEEQPSLGESMANAGVNTLLGMGTVFVMLIVMAYVISLMKYIPKLLSPKQKAPEAVAIPAAPVPAPVPTSVAEEELSNDEELVAVISAAIAAYEGEAGIDGFVVRSIRRHSRG